MAKEIERKFRIDLEQIDLTTAESINYIKQAYVDRNLIKFNKENQSIEIINNFDILFSLKISDDDFKIMIDNKLLDNNFNFDNKTIFRLRTNIVVKNNVEIKKEGFFTIKGKTDGVSRDEFEYNLDFYIIQSLINLICTKKIEKTRYKIIDNNHLWEVDIFMGRNEGLSIAEIELTDENEEFVKPKWVTKEVSDDYNYYNNNLIANPFNSWF